MSKLFEPDGLGFGFSDSLFGGMVSKRHDVKFSTTGWTLSLFLLPLIVGFLVIGLRLVWLMGVMGVTYRSLSDENRIRVIPIKGIRGTILDRNGKILAAVKPAFKKIVNLYELRGVK